MGEEGKAFILLKPSTVDYNIFITSKAKKNFMRRLKILCYDVKIGIT